MENNQAQLKPFPFTQVRIARPTESIGKIVEFYSVGLGFEQIGSFNDHEGISGVILGMPGAAYHLEFTQHGAGAPCPPPTHDNLLVYYMQDRETRDVIVNRLFQLGYATVMPSNPYWIEHGLTIEDPDKWRVVLMDLPNFNDPQ